MIINNTTYVLNDEECSFDNCYTEQALIFIPEVQIIFLILYGIVSLVGIVGNLFIVITVVRYIACCSRQTVPLLNNTDVKHQNWVPWQWQKIWCVTCLVLENISFVLFLLLKASFIWKCNSSLIQVNIQRIEWIEWIEWRLD